VYSISSIFRYYLSRLLCRHFHRIASIDDTSPEARQYYSGTSYIYGDDIAEGPASKSQPTGFNTALHDAVLTESYSVVEYLLRSNFVVTARDEQGRSPMDLALAMSKADGASYKSREILALLQQHPSNTKVKFNLPLGWQSVQAGQSTIYTESSIESPIPSVTFQEPQTGLFEDRKLALAERKFQGHGETYILNPLRFLRKSSEQALQHMQLANEPYFNESWYRDEVIRTRLPPTDPFLDERFWYRNTAKIFYYSWTAMSILLSLNIGYVFLIFVPIWLFGRILGWNQNLQLASSLLAIGPLLSALLLCNTLILRSLRALDLFKDFALILTYMPHLSVRSLNDPSCPRLPCFPYGSG
jgi:hypothetical protein